MGDASSGLNIENRALGVFHAVILQGTRGNHIGVSAGVCLSGRVSGLRVLRFLVDLGPIKLVSDFRD